VVPGPDGGLYPDAADGSASLPGVKKDKLLAFSF
jgi:hypothetical protein